MISPEQLAALMHTGAEAPHAVLDLRERAAFERGHIFRATPLPRRLLEFRLAPLITARATPIVVYDEQGRLSALARPTLRSIGYDDVRILTGGLAAWRAAGQPVVQGLNVPSKVFGERVLHELGTPSITPDELRARMAVGADMIIVDARTPEEYVRGCIPGAWSVPGGELVRRITELAPRPDTTIVVHCGGRTRSYIGAESLRRMGLTNPVVALENGTMGWELAGLELERGAGRWAPAPSAASRRLAARVAERIAAEDRVALVSADELRDLWAQRERENVTILDVRSAEEYAQGHLAGAIWAPGGQAIQATDEYIAVRAARIVVTCDDAARSTVTAAWLMRMGLPRVAVLAGGGGRWAERDGAIETGHPSTPPWGYDSAQAAVSRVPPGRLGSAVILNVDPSDVYRRGHVPGAAWLCRSRLELLITRVLDGPAVPAILTCDDGAHSTLAAATLGALGYCAVQVLEGGTQAWRAAGLPVESGPTRLVDEPDDVVLKPYERGRPAMQAYLRWEEALDTEGRSPHALLPPREDRR